MREGTGSDGGLCKLQQGQDQGHSHIHAELCLLEIGGSGVVVHLDGDLVDSWKRVENKHVILCERHFCGIQNVEILQADVVLLIEETFLLDAGHIEQIKLWHDILQTDDLTVADAAFLEHIRNVVGNLELLRRDEEKTYSVITGEGIDEGVYGAAEFQIAAETDCKVVQSALQGAYCEKIGQRLGRMLMSAVSGINYGNAGFLTGNHGSTLLGVAHGADVCVAGDDADGVGYAFALGGGRGSGIREADDTPAQPCHSGFKAQPGSCARLIEAGRKDLAVAGMGVAGWIVFNVVCKVEEPVKLVRRKVQRTH